MFYILYSKVILMNKITDDERFNKLLYKKIVELFNGNNSYSDAIYNTIPHSKIIYNGKEIWDKNNNWNNPTLNNGVLYIEQSYDSIHNKIDGILIII